MPDGKVVISGGWLQRLARWGLLVTGLATLAALGAEVSEFLALFSHFAVQYLLIQLAATIVFLSVRQWPLAFTALLIALPNLVAVGPYLPGLIKAVPPPVSTQTPIRLVSANLLARLEDPAATLAYQTQANPDVLVLSELTPRWREKLGVLERRYPYFALRTRWNSWGIGVYSRYPMEEVKNLDLGDNLSSHLSFRLVIGEGKVQIYAVHLASPPSTRSAPLQSTQLEKLGALLALPESALPTLVVGDFNSTPYSPAFQSLLRQTGLRDARRPFGLHITWPVWPLPIWIPIDHCLVRGSLEVGRVSIGTRTGSDHFPLECDFSLTGKS